MPGHWEDLRIWIEGPGTTNWSAPENQSSLKPPKFPDLPLLADYSSPPPESFWKLFPFNPLPEGPKTAVRADRLRILVKRFGKNWSTTKKRVARRAEKNLLRGARPPLKKDLPPMTAQNAGTAILHGPQVTDTIADWVDRGFVAGPFDQPPLKNFRCNPVMAIVQPGKIRPVLNMSAPEGRSFNDAVNEELLPKLSMSTAKEFSFSARAAGKGAKISKLDLKDAYKNIPCHPDFWASQGFTWLGKFFVDLSSVFGSKSAPSDFDCLGATIGELALTISRLPRSAYHRTLDDTTIVCSRGSSAGNRFVKVYRQICKFINIELAEEDPAREKAFSNCSEGTVLGIRFNTQNGTWSLPERRYRASEQLLRIMVDGSAATLHLVQQLIGVLEAFGQMAPFTRGFKWNLLQFLRDFSSDTEKILRIPEVVKTDLNIWLRILRASAAGLPVVPRQTSPPIGSCLFVSDAAGRVPKGSSGSTAGASIGTHDGGIWFGAKIAWPIQLLWAVGGQIVTLDILAAMLPLLLAPNQLRHRHVVLQTNNNMMAWGWRKRHLKQNALASILLRALHILEAALPCRLHVISVAQDESPPAELAARLTRSTTSSTEDKALLTHGQHRLPAAMKAWLTSPVVDWNLGLYIASEINKY